MFSFSDQMLQYPPTERKWKSSVEVAPNCPRCASSNTKFCYYNNYSLSQPRYFCKGCRRYWTKGGSLRNVPVGGGCRKSRRGKSSTNRVDKSSMNYSSKSSLSSFRRGEDGSGNKPDGSDIDLAVVFAKFLNQNSTADFDRPDMIITHESPIEADASNSSNDSSMEYFHKPVFPEPYMLQEIPQVEQQPKEENNSIQELLETNEFELPNLLADEIVQMQDVLWSDDAADTTQSQNLEWQPMVQLQQQFGNSLPLEDQLKISTNYLMNENWSSFDLSGFGINFSNL